MHPRRKILGHEISCITLEEAVQHCLAYIRGDRRPRIISTINAATLVMAKSDERLESALQASELVLADGMPIFWIARALGGRSPRRVAGVDLMAELIGVAARERLRLYFLGARPEVLRELVRRVADEHGEAVIAGARDGYFTPEQFEEVVREVHDSRADILFVGMHSPFKEVWSHENLEALGTPVILPVGGAFDVLSGFIRRAPLWVQSCGLEWLWRTMMDPWGKGRRYLETNPIFIGLVVKAFVRRLLCAFPFSSRRLAHFPSGSGDDAPSGIGDSAPSSLLMATSVASEPVVSRCPQMAEGHRRELLPAGLESTPLSDGQVGIRPDTANRADTGTSPRPVPATRPDAKEPDAKEKDPTIETLRGLAILAVVVGHVIGDVPNGGLRVEPGSIYRHLYDATTYLRMPMFFVISGFLYAHRPVVTGRFSAFAIGKARLLLLPFLSVATLQYLMKMIAPGVNVSGSIRDIWRIYVFGFDQFWFSQATMCTFAAVLLAEKVLPLSSPFKWPIYLTLAIAFDLVVPKTGFFSLNMFSMMLPFFLLGCLLHRPSSRLQGPAAVSAALLVLLASVTTQQLVWFEQLTLTGLQRLVLMLCEGLSFTFLMFRFRWAGPRLAFLGGFAYPIYLFHVFGTAGSRILATQLGITDRLILLATGTVCGLFLPIAIDLLFRRSAILRRVFLGRR